MKIERPFFFEKRVFLSGEAVLPPYLRATKGKEPGKVRIVLE